MRMQLTKEQKVADRFLRGYDIIADRLESSIVGLENAESARNSITSSIDSMSLSVSQHDKMAESLIRMDTAIDDLCELTDAFSDQFTVIEDFVTEVQRRDSVAGKVLRLAYINRLSVEQISKRDDTSYSKKTVYEYMKRGLDVAFEILLEEGTR